ncbi:cryptochrome/photolyase family protein [Candidatus Poriferisodalis sp.]|uniref:cryptochrome/photolyase family protein n=1 Tax=Candidatus Poriferisodalis sp. TaxID=3101277 RepID=UPI003B0109FB
MSDLALAWFRRDLRLTDNPAWAAATSGRTAVPVVVLEPQLCAAAGPHRLRAYLGALAGLDRALQRLGASLRATVGDPAQELPRMAAELGTTTVCVNTDVTPYSKRRDRLAAAALGCPLEVYWGTVVQPPGSVLTRSGALSRVFTPFWRRWQATPLPPRADADNKMLCSVKVAMTLSDALAELARRGVKLPTPQPDSHRTGGESDSRTEMWSADCAEAQLERWLTAVDRYDESRDLFGAGSASQPRLFSTHAPAGRPCDLCSIGGTSQLSVALRFGLLSPRAVVAAVGTGTPGRAAFVRQLAWRDWYAHLTWEHPHIATRALKPPYDRVAWRTGDQAARDFDAWCAGRTGYPIVDAAMRQLAATGWIHNRLRMVAASFLVKDLLVDWRRGERWFRRLLTDGELAQNAGNWQWVAGTGPDAAPYFRVFNPVAQSRRFDPDGTHLRQWLPELARLPTEAIHAPWEVSPELLAAAGVTLGSDYPAPIVDHGEARLQTLAAYQATLAESG